MVIIPGVVLWDRSKLLYSTISGGHTGSELVLTACSLGVLGSANLP